MTQAPTQPRYYRALVGGLVYFCPVRRMDAIALIRHRFTFWTDRRWVNGGSRYLINPREPGRMRLDGDLRQHAMEMITAYNIVIGPPRNLHLDHLIDESFDDFESTYGVGSWWMTTRAAIKASRT